ncbi:MAG: urea ABC transporter permease subunit UrtB, partial [Chthoniobacterales bacterium]|nr:urea ABC transporter permease subunit UrtB [Chthoniobacterales bacterium]
AHGEIMIIGGYTVFVVQCLFGTGLALAPFGFSFNLPGLGLDPASNLYQAYFLISLPIAFLISAIVGLILERGIIQFLYQRPLETLLATWGISLILQQLFRLIFGPANIPVTAPAWLTGSYVVEGVIMNYNRIFVIFAAFVILVATWLLLARTPLGLLIRAVIQDRSTAACMGVSTGKVNSLTFAFGSGLAGVAGALLALLGNIGPSTGQTYIVDAFMVVVLGGVGNLAGTVLSALGIGTLDQILQISLRNPVIGKVLVLVGIILFLQWKPSGLFTIRSRSLDEG